MLCTTLLHNSTFCTGVLSLLTYRHFHAWVTCAHLAAYMMCKVGFYITPAVVATPCVTLGF